VLRSAPPVVMDPRLRGDDGERIAGPAEGTTSGGGWRGDVPPLFLTAAATLAISLRIPVRRGARSRGVADAGRGTVLRQVSHACRREAARCKTRCPPKRTVREEPSGSSHRHTRAGRLLAPSLDLTPSRHSRRGDDDARPLGSLAARSLTEHPLPSPGDPSGSEREKRPRQPHGSTLSPARADRHAFFMTGPAALITPLSAGA